LNTKQSFEVTLAAYKNISLSLTHTNVDFIKERTNSRWLSY
jgi:hypothetical protein